MLTSVKSFLARSSRIIGGLAILGLLLNTTACTNATHNVETNKTTATTYYEGPFSEIPVSRDWKYSGNLGEYKVTLKLSKYRMVDEVKAEDHPAKKGFLPEKACPNIENGGVLAGVITIKMEEAKEPFAPNIDFEVKPQNPYMMKVVAKMALANGESSDCKAFDSTSLKSRQIKSAKKLSKGESVSYPIFLFFTPRKNTDIKRVTPDTSELSNFSFNFLPIDIYSGKYQSSGDALSLPQVIKLGK